MKHLYLFTASYPYDGTETFLDDEIPFLTSVFEEVTIIPLYGNKRTREVPDNCIVKEPVEPNDYHRYLSLLYPNKATRLFLVDFVCKRVFLSLKRIKTWLIAYRQIANLLNNKQITELFARIRKEDVCYFYWGKGSITLAAVYKGKATFVSRFHGEWDLWEESSGHYAALRNKIAGSLSMAAFISKKGELYFRNKYHIKRSEVFPLGSFDNGICKRSNDQTIRIVSCSMVYPLKRVSLIHDALLASNKNIEWTHIGGGQQYAELESRVCHKSRNGLKVNLLGNVPHDEVIKYYQTHTVDIFINLSTNEGVPVSIMEAISFNIPVVATDVGATSEIVCGETGRLLSPNPSIDEINEAICDVIKMGDIICPKDYWSNHYDASANYKRFAETLLSLS